MGFFDSALKNIVKKAKPLLPVAAMAAAPMMWPKMAAFMGAGGKGAGLGSLLGKYMGKYSALPMLAKAPLTSAATSYGLAKLLKQRNPERAALYGALASLPFAYMKANAFANALDGEGGFSAWDVLKSPGGEDLMSTAYNTQIQPGMDQLTYTDSIMGGPPNRNFMTEKVRPAIPRIINKATTTSVPGMGLEDLLTNLESREGFLGNEIKKGGFDWRAFMPLMAAMFGAQPDEEQMAEDAKEKEKDRMKQLYAMMANPYYSHVPESFEFTPYAVARGGAINKSIGGGISTLEYTDPDLYTPTGEGGGPSSNPILQLPLGPEGSFTDEFEELDVTEVGSGIESYHKLLADKYRPWLEDMDIDTTGMEDLEIIDAYSEIASKYAHEAKGGITELDLQGGGASNGPGTGTSDSIPAKLSDGEFVMTAKAVENFGGGDRHQGAKKMYQMMNTLDPNSEKPSEAKAIV